MQHNRRAYIISCGKSQLLEIQDVILDKKACGGIMIIVDNHSVKSRQLLTTSEFVLFFCYILPIHHANY